jgi:hypothetical protein|tara:strand:- start:55 stop:225 length:171 start_codon:yes stop_codon:yes gene_type:complete
VVVLNEDTPHQVNHYEISDNEEQIDLNLEKEIMTTIGIKTNLKLTMRINNNGLRKE